MSAALAVSSVSFAACSVLIDAEPKQCDVNRDCTVRGGAFAKSECIDGYCVAEETEEVQPGTTCSKDVDCDESEACLDKKCESRWACVEESSVAPMGSGQIRVSFLVASSFNEPMPSVSGKACRSIDPSCSSPVAEAVSDEDGLFRFTLPKDFTGYVDVTMEPFFPVLYYFPTPLNEATPLPVLSLTPAELIQGLGKAVGAEPDPERGHVLLTAMSCLGTAPGVHLSAPKADQDTIAFYVLDGIPSADRDATTAAGSGGFLNFPPGNAVVDLSSGKAKTVTSLSLTVRPGYITSVAFNPGGLQQVLP